MATIQQTGFLLPQTIISNGLTTGNQWSNPNNLLLVDGDTANSNNGQASDIIVGNFNFNLPENSVITGIEMQVIGYNGGVTSPVTTLTPYAVDNTSGENLYYPYVTPFSGFTTSLATYTLGTSSYLFATNWTVDQINNFKLQLVSNGPLFIDAVLVNVFYYVNAPSPEPTPSDACIDCQSQIQAQPFTLALPVSNTDTSIYVNSFNLPDGTPINTSMLGACGGDIDIVMDQGHPRGNGQPFEENAKVINITPQSNGTVLLDFATITNRALKFTTPYTHDASLISEHNAGGEVVISNNGPYYDKFLKKCQIGSLVSAPLEVDQENVLVAIPVTKLNFIGSGQSTTVDLIDPEKVNIVIPGVGGTTPPVITATNSVSSGNVQVSMLSVTLDISGLNRGAAVQISTQEIVTIVSVTIGGVSASQKAVAVDAGHDLRAEEWVCVNPPLGSQLVIVTLSSPAYLTFGAECLAGIDTVTPVGTVQSATGTSNEPILSLTTTYDNSTIIDGLCTAQVPILYIPGSGQALNWSLTANVDTRQGGSSVQSAGLEPDVILMQYSITQNTPWAYVSVEIKGITNPTPPSTGVQSVTGLGVNNADPANPVVNPYVQARTSDTTPSVLNNKLNIHSSDSSVTVTKTITNPSGNEIIDYDLSTFSSGGALSSFQIIDGGTGTGAPTLCGSFCDSTGNIWAVTTVDSGTSYQLRKGKINSKGIVTALNLIGNITPHTAFNLTAGFARPFTIYNNNIYVWGFIDDGSNIIFLADVYDLTGAYVGSTNSIIIGVPAVIFATHSLGATIVGNQFYVISEGTGGHASHQVTGLITGTTTISSTVVTTASTSAFGGGVYEPCLKISTGNNNILVTGVVYDFTTGTMGVTDMNVNDSILSFNNLIANKIGVEGYTGLSKILGFYGTMTTTNTFTKMQLITGDFVDTTGTAYAI